MCGIFFSTSPGLGEAKFSQALDLMTYRGPDATGVLCSGALQLGHRRLSIIDLDDRSRQPFVSSDGRHAIVFNGEIYNFRELARQHRLTLRTTSDTEVLLALWQRLGPAVLNQLNGMFAFVIADLQTGRWFAARDRLGVKPLYMADWGGGLLLSSEPAPLLQVMGRRDFDAIGLRQYRKLRTFFNGRTVWAGIRQFPAGHWLDERGVLQRWWQLPEGPQEPPADDELRALVTDAVRLRLVADVPVGSFLSGGLDSTIVAALAGRPDTWTVGFAEHNEFEWGRLAASRLGSNHREVDIEPDEFLSLAGEMVARRCEPLSVPNEVLLYKMTRSLAPHDKVVLCGEGADELFFGYDRIFRWAAGAPWDLRRFAELYGYGSGNDLDIVEDAVSPFMGRGAAINIVAAFFQVAHLQGLLRRLDSATMLASVEAREPFVDYRLVERLAGVPFDWRMADGVVKAPLKRVFADVVPAGILARPKLGFPVPLGSIPFDPESGATAMDRWFEFNLSTLAGTSVRAEEVL